MSQLVPLKAKLQTFRQLLVTQAPELQKAVPRGVDPQRLARVALTVLATKPQLLDCTPQSVMGAIMKAAAFGLELDPELAQAYLVPYKTTCQMLTGYQGLIALAMRSSEVKSVVARAVYDKDEFVFEYGLNERLVHRPSPHPDKGQLAYVYAVAKLVDGDGMIPVFEVMSRQEVEKIRERSRAKNDGPWVTDYEMMARKTVVRRIAKWLPKSTQLQDVLAHEDRVERDPGVAQGVDDLIDEVLSAEAQVPLKSETATTAPALPAAGPSALDQLAQSMPSTSVMAAVRAPAAASPTPEHDPRTNKAETPTARDLSRQEQSRRHEVPRAHRIAESAPRGGADLASEVSWGPPPVTGRDPGEEG